MRFCVSTSASEMPVMPSVLGMLLRPTNPALTPFLNSPHGVKPPFCLTPVRTSPMSSSSGITPAAGSTFAPGLVGGGTGVTDPATGVPPRIEDAAEAAGAGGAGGACSANGTNLRGLAPSGCWVSERGTNLRGLAPSVCCSSERGMNFMLATLRVQCIFRCGQKLDCLLRPHRRAVLLL